MNRIRFVKDAITKASKIYCYREAAEELKELKNRYRKLIFMIFYEIPEIDLKKYHAKQEMLQ
ncbi:hypothetical protein L1276_000590 [Flavobacterium sp. HSC-32F16]|uniref:hypothetical protein n=1 Tax=Flavobacterium sp. HSC-32F16 TaxID=2910964 RepID=UPI0020A473EC|nr:hypothetical protein [Flavobacterium sp. HSC-32F16]MCP2025450.1 hypothetical protein [Flavobacterium sp. HSC-32F16]